METHISNRPPLFSLAPGQGPTASRAQGTRGRAGWAKSAWGASPLGHSSARPLGGGPLREPREGTGPGALDRFPSPRPHEDPAEGSTGGREESQLGEPRPPPSHQPDSADRRPNCLKRKLFLSPSGAPIGTPCSVLRTEALQPTGRRDVLWVRVQAAQLRGQEKGTWIHPFPAERSSDFPV